VPQYRKIENRERRNDADVDSKPHPKTISQECDIYAHDHDCHHRDVKHDGHCAHFVSSTSDVTRRSVGVNRANPSCDANSREFSRARQAVASSSAAEAELI
jgi:hypothetical protein